MFGYACRETPDLMPAPIYYSHKILELLAARAASRQRRSRQARPGRQEPGDGALRRRQAGRGHADRALDPAPATRAGTSEKVRKVVEPYIREALGDLKIADDCNWYINPTGKFVIGGPDGDAGLTGRKIIVDTYGGAAPHGGGAFSGKDTTKVDRSAAYAARYLAKNVVAAKLADRCTIQLSYAIGVAQPLSIYVDLHGTGKVEEAQARGSAARGHGPVALAASASISTSTSRSTPRPRPMAISAASRAATVRSPGRRPTSSRRSRTPWPPDGRCHDRQARAQPFDRSLLRPPARQDAAPAPGDGACRCGLPRYRLDLDAGACPISPTLFPSPVAEVRLEIGFGGGEHLLHGRRATPATGFIGVEPFVNGMAKMMAALDETPLANIRVYDDDATRLLDWLPDASLGGDRSPLSRTPGRRRSTGSGASSAGQPRPLRRAC